MAEVITKQEVQAMEQKNYEVIEKAESYVIDSKEGVDEASTFLKEIRDTEKVIETKRLEFTKPLNQSLKAINGTFKGLIKPLAEARELLSNKVLKWKREEYDRIAAEEARRRKIQEAHEVKGHNVNKPVVMEQVENKIGNTQVRKVWTFDVEDFAKVPDFYKQLDTVEVNSAIRNGEREIPGIKIYQEDKLSIVGR